MFSVCLLLFLFSIGTSQATTVCYGKYGCFSDDPPFDNPIISLPSDPETIATKFVLYTREDAHQKGEILDTDKNASITKSTFDSLLKVKFIVHGFTDNGQTAWVKEMVRELLKKEKMNVIVVDWGLGSSALNLYDAAAGNTRLVGAQVADLIDVLNRKFRVAFKKFHIIGHSLGAHVAGFAGEKLVKSGKAIGRITGLDPARPGFDSDQTAVRLDPSDAMFVDVIHSDVNNGLIDSSLGLQRPCGDVDFYPNGGKQQPGCGTSNVMEGALDSFLDNAQVSLSWIVACNHMKAVAYFTSSINSPCAMKAFPCDNWEDFQEGKCLSCDGACPQMGYNADQRRANERVLAFLKTVEDKPFCASDNYYRITLHSRDTSGFFSLFSTVLNKIKITLTGSKGQVQTDHVRDVQFGKESFVLSSARDVGQLQSIKVHFKGSGFFLKKAVVYSKVQNKRYTACFQQHMENFLLYLKFASYTRNLLEGRQHC